MRITSIIIDYTDTGDVKKYTVTYEIKKDEDYVTGRVVFNSDDIDLKDIKLIVNARANALNEYDA